MKRKKELKYHYLATSNKVMDLSICEIDAPSGSSQHRLESIPTKRMEQKSDRLSSSNCQCTENRGDTETCQMTLQKCNQQKQTERLSFFRTDEAVSSKNKGQGKPRERRWRGILQIKRGFED